MRPSEVRVVAPRLACSTLLAAAAAGLALASATECSAPTPLPPYGAVPLPDGSWPAPTDAGPSGDVDAAPNDDGSVQTVDGAEITPTDSGGDTSQG
jgi:hypothetical protein